MPGRKFSAGVGYRYGFNGKENDNEVKGEGAQQDYGMRIYDPRLGRFLSVDPLFKSYAHLTPYQFASNRPIVAIDLDGAEALDQSSRYIGLNKFASEMISKGQWHGSPLDFVLFHEKCRSIGGAVGVTFWFGGAWLGAYGGTALTTVTNVGIQAYAKYPIIASIGSFAIGLVDESPPETLDIPGPFDEAGRATKYVFMKFVAPSNEYAAKFILKGDKLDYLFGKLKYSNFNSKQLEDHANQIGQTVKKLTDNIRRSNDNKRILESWGVIENQKGYEWLADAFEKGLNGKEISRRTAEDGSISILREVSVLNKNTNEKVGTLQIGYVYRNGDLNSTPEISSIIPKPVSSKK